MQNIHPMNRRTFLISALSCGAIGVAGGSFWLRQPAHLDDLSIQALLDFLTSLDASKLRSDTRWSVAQTFYHMAQSVDYSISGYPQHKPDWFKSTLGAAAFSVFAAKREMTHNLEEAIPGAPDAPITLSPDEAIAQLMTSLKRFHHYEGPLADHFAYGPLSKQEYSLAHVMHVRNHFEQIDS